MEQYRLVATPEGPITYRLVKKRVKNLNLRLDRAGEVVLSVPLRCPAERADAFVIEKSGWIVGHLPRPEEDPAALRQAVDAVRQRHQYPALLIPGMGEALSL